MSNLRDQLTYADLAGRRRLRLYVMAALMIFLGVAAVFLLGQTHQEENQAMLETTPRPLSQMPPTLAPTHTPPPTATSPPETCPADPATWTLAEVFPGDHYQRLEPPCVLAGLAQTVAWHMLERLGYSKPEAAHLLAFETLPWQPAATITGLTNTQGPLPIALTMEWAPHPSYRYWTVDAEGNPGLLYSLRGCYRTRDILGNAAEAWDTRPVHCVVALDYTPGWVVNQLDDHIYAANWAAQPATRTFVLFGYTGTSWGLLGELQGQQISLAQANSLPGEQASAAMRYGAEVWDAHWLEETYGLTMHPLPEGWQTFTDPAGIQAISDALNAFNWQPPE